MSQPVRLQKDFTDCGILSRRHAEEEIAAVAGVGRDLAAAVKRAACAAGGEKS